MSLNAPSTPALAPSIYLPRILTSFPTSTTATETFAVQFELPTPSPLSLGKTPVTIAIRGDLLQYQGADEADEVSPEHDAMSARCAQQAPPKFDSTTAERATQDLLITSSAMSYSGGRSHSRSPIFKSKSKSSKHHRRRRHHHQNLSSRTRKQQGNAPKLHIVVPPTPRTKQRRAVATHIITYLAYPLVPLVSVTTGESHPGFPSSILQFQLLTHDQLDSLARWYHQTSDAGRERWDYPCPLDEGKTWCRASSRARNGDEGMNVDLDTKRRRWGRFIGLRGCESPVVQQQQQVGQAEQNGAGNADNDMDMEDTKETTEEMRARLDREWREALRRAREQDLLREKTWRGRF